MNKDLQERKRNALVNLEHMSVQAYSLMTVGKIKPLRASE